MFILNLSGKQITFLIHIIFTFVGKRRIVVNLYFDFNASFKHVKVFLKSYILDISYRNRKV